MHALRGPVCYADMFLFFVDRLGKSFGLMVLDMLRHTTVTGWIGAPRQCSELELHYGAVTVPEQLEDIRPSNRCVVARARLGR